MTIPAFGLGTFRLEGQTVIDSVNTALELGYRMLDTAQFYNNEADIGRAVAASGVPRADIFRYFHHHQSLAGQLHPAAAQRGGKPGQAAHRPG